MPGEEHKRLTDDRARTEWRRTEALHHMGPMHTSKDCHELVLRLKAQAQCLEEILSDIRSQIDEFECDEIIDQIREKLEAEI